MITALPTDTRLYAQDTKRSRSVPFATPKGVGAKADDPVILVVEDNATNRELFSRMLQHQGYRVLTAENGQEGLRAMRELGARLDVVLLDLMMPVMDGHEVLEHMKADPLLRHLPVIVVSALGELNSVLRCIERGADDYITKPFNHVLLLARVRAALDKKRLRDQEQAANEAKTRFLRFAAHELRNPITTLAAYTDLLCSCVAGPLTGDQETYLEQIQQSILRLTVLASDLSDISEIEAGRLALRPSRLSLPHVIHEAIQCAQDHLEAKKHRLEIGVPPGLPPVWADRVRLIQVLINLLTNAAKYTPPEGQIRVTAAPDAGNAMPPMVQVAVQDNGFGIHPDEQAKVFQEFFRSEDKRIHEAPGMGLGLSITKRLVEMQGGHIWFESEFQKGTTFHFTVPVATDRQA